MRSIFDETIMGASIFASTIESPLNITLPSTPPRVLGPNQLKYCRTKFPVFSISEKQAQAAKDDTKAYRDRFLISERGKL